MNKKPRELKYCGIDYWSRPVFKDRKDNYFGSLDKLYPDGQEFEELISGEHGITEKDIVYFGTDLDADPMGTIISPNKIKLVKEFDETLTIEEQY